MRWMSLFILLAFSCLVICGQDRKPAPPQVSPPETPVVTQQATVVNQALLTLKSSHGSEYQPQRKLAELATRDEGEAGPFAADGYTNQDVEEAARAYGRSHVPERLRYHFTFTPPPQRHSDAAASPRTWSALQRYFDLQRGSAAYRQLKHINRQTTQPMRTGIGSGPPATPRRYIR